jgi:hypothetical protein
LRKKGNKGRKKKKGNSRMCKTIEGGQGKEGREENLKRI